MTFSYLEHNIHNKRVDPIPGDVPQLAPHKVSPPVNLLLQKVSFFVKRPSLDSIKKVASLGANLATNPVGTAGGILRDSVGRIIETDEEGNALPEVEALQIKMDRMNEYLAFLCRETNPMRFAQIFGSEQIEDEPSEESLITQEVSL